MQDRRRDNQHDRQEPDRQKNPKGMPPGGPMRPGRNSYHWVILLLMAMIMLVLFGRLSPQADKIRMDEFLQRLDNGDVKKVTISSDDMKGEMHESAMVGLESQTPQFRVNITPDQVAWLSGKLEASSIEWDIKKPSIFNQLIYFIPWILIFVFMYFFVFRQFRGGGGAGMLGSFGRSRHQVSNKEESKVTFENVAGIDEAKEEVQEVIQFLRSPKKFQRLGGRIPRGVLLIGEPGCGKTLLAKAIAGEADVPFFNISGSDFVEMFVGVGASRVRDLFKQAKENSPCIIFLVEIVAVGRKRGTGVAGGGHDEREQTLNAILVEMDGFSTNDQVIVIAATNRADVLDHALTRPGRFDRQIYVPLPDIKGRFEILKVHAKKIKMGPDTDLHRLARVTPMFSGADLEAIINEAALAATMEEKDCVEMIDFEEARDKVRWGRARRSRVIDEKEKVATAYHESGHALIQSMLEHADPVHKVSIIPRSNMGGATFSLPEKDRTMYTRQYCLAMIKVCFGGRLAEEIFCHDISSGAQGDIKQATEIARKMIMEWGMSESLGFVHYGNENGIPGFVDFGGAREFSDKTADLIDSEIKQLMDQNYKEVKNILEKHRDQMEAMKDALMKYETLDGDEVKQIIEGKTLDKPTVGDLLAAEQQRHDEQKATEQTKTKNTPEPDNGLTGPMPQPGLS
ncbi:MAG: ATP-dependent zinc metalloprotease FtsH [Planctomycetes bacterium]|nr:ATP-dependent zinc metalloprotease FtsH [Planctomycetota bacterium]